MIRNQIIRAIISTFLNTKSITPISQTTTFIQIIHTSQSTTQINPFCRVNCSLIYLHFFRNQPISILQNWIISCPISQHVTRLTIYFSLIIIILGYIGIPYLYIDKSRIAGNFVGVFWQINIWRIIRWNSVTQDFHARSKDYFSILGIRPKIKCLTHHLAGE